VTSSARPPRFKGSSFVIGALPASPTGTLTHADALTGSYGYAVPIELSLNAMTADLTILPVGSNAQVATVLADVLQEIRRRGIIYQVAGTTTALEGTWDQITETARACHNIGRRYAPHVVTLIRIEDDLEGANELAAVQPAAGETSEDDLGRLPPLVAGDEVRTKSGVASRVRPA